MNNRFINILLLTTVFCALCSCVIAGDNENKSGKSSSQYKSNRNSSRTPNISRYGPSRSGKSRPQKKESGDCSKVKGRNSPKQFSNACTPPCDNRSVIVPKTLKTLRSQLGRSFRVARRGPFLIAANLNSNNFATLVDGVVACCRQCLSRDYFKIPPRKVITIYVFKDESTYRAGLRLYFHMNPISPYGHYGYSQRYIVVNYDTGPGTLVHELTHAMMAPDFPQAPIWISEGMASLYEQCRVENNSLKGDPNWRLPELKRTLKQGKVTPLRRLMAMTVTDFRAKQESLHYAESRYFCKFMEERGVLRKVYQDFRDHHAKDPSGITFVEAAFGVKLDIIESEWHAWLKGQTWKK